MHALPRVLTDYDAKEAISLKQAASIANRSVETCREWASMRDLGRKLIAAGRGSGDAAE